MIINGFSWLLCSKRNCFISRTSQRLAKFFTNSAGASKLMWTTALDKDYFLFCQGYLECCIYICMPLNFIDITAAYSDKMRFLWCLHLFWLDYKCKHHSDLRKNCVCFFKAKLKLDSMIVGDVKIIKSTLLFLGCFLGFFVLCFNIFPVTVTQGWC